MKLKMKITVAVLACVGIFSSCNSDNENDAGSGNDVPGKAVEAAFWVKYPNASGVKWEAEGDFRQADFKWAGVDYETWYDKSGIWLQSEHSMSYADLPQAVGDAVSSSINYPSSSWTPESSVEVWEMLNGGLWYGVELKSGQEDVTVWYYADGEVIKEVTEDYSGDEIPGQISNFLNRQYPKSVELTVEKFVDARFDAVILDSKQVKIVYFDRTYTWEHTAWFVAKEQVPQVVLDVLSEPAYEGYDIKRIEYRQLPTAGYYHFVLVKTGSAGMTVNIDATGNVVLN